MSKKTTLDEIAHAAGVSVATVDRVVNGRGGVSPKSEAKVLEWATKLNLDRIAYRKHMRTLRIAVLIPPPQDPFFVRMRDSVLRMNAALAEAKVSSFIQHIDRADIKSIRERIQSVATGYDGLIICAPAEDAIMSAVEKIAAKMPVVTLVTDLPGTGRHAYVGPDNHKMGRLAGELMGRFLGADGGDVIAMMGLRKQQDQKHRQAGLREVLAERFAKVQIVDGFEAYDNPERVAMQMLQALTDHPNVRGVYNPTAGNIGVRKAIEALGIQHHIVIVTHELTPERKDLLTAGKIDAVIDQNPDLEARRALEIIANHHGRPTSLTDEAFTPFSLFLRENV
ncbi:MAG: LacI family DNA-binding transcriptional regulator [Pseudomonadota bacterium]